MPKMASESISGILDKDLAIENGPVPAELFQCFVLVNMVGRIGTVSFEHSSIGVRDIEPPLFVWTGYDHVWQLHGGRARDERLY